MFGHTHHLCQTLNYSFPVLLNPKGNIIHELGQTEGDLLEQPLTNSSHPISRGDINAQNLVKAYCYELYEKLY